MINVCLVLVLCYFMACHQSGLCKGALIVFDFSSVCICLSVL